MVTKILIKIFAKFMKVFGGKILSKQIYKETGHEVNISFKDFRADMIDNKLIIHIDADTVFDKALLKRLFKSID